jgi:GrxC family glutaredoxin
MDNTIIVYTKSNCPYCDYAKSFLAEQKIQYIEKRIDTDASYLSEMVQKTKGRTVPQIIIKGLPIGGYDDMMKLVDEGTFKDLI